MSYPIKSLVGFCAILGCLGFFPRVTESADLPSVNPPCSKQVTSVVRALMMVNGENYRLLDLNYLGTIQGSRSQPQHVLRAMATDPKTNDNNHTYEAYAEVDSCRVVRVQHIEGES